MQDIFLVEDTDSDAELLVRTLKLVGVANPVRRISNGAEAMSHLIYLEKTGLSAVPSVLFLDLKLPGLSGFEILQRIQGRALLSKMLRVTLSQIDDTRSIKQAYVLGAHSFLIKPVTELDLRELIGTFPGYWAFDSPTPPARSQPRI